MSLLRAGVLQRAGQWREVLLQALFSLRENTLRTLLSMLGIAVGVAAVLVVGTVSQEVKQRVFAELESFGLETLWIYRYRDEAEPYKNVRQGSGIDNEDLKALAQCCASVLRVSPVVYSEAYTARVRAGNHYMRANFEGVGLNYQAINHDNIISGRGFREDDMQQRKAVALIGQKVSKKLFGERGNPVGQALRWGDTRLTVIGVLGDKQRDLLTQIGANTYDAGKRVLIPYTLYQQRLGSKQIHTLQAQAVSVARVQQAQDEIIQLLNRRHSGHFYYRVDNMKGWINTAEDILHKISLAGLLAASISLLVGGIGIMNIMSTSVIERTREIGIRKALGARRRDILMQFLMESVVVSLFGGGLGLVLGAAVIFFFGVLSGYALAISWPLALIALLVSVIVGVVSGYYPAYRAATLRPVDALRYE